MTLGVLPEGFTADWSFVPSKTRLIDRARRARGFAWRRQPAPDHRVLKAIVPAPHWALLFLFIPSGVLSAAQRHSLGALRRLNRSLLVIAAADDAARVPVDVHEAADALIWKALPGFDFSAYSLGLNLIAEGAPGADVLVMNDSVYGPFGDVEAWIDRAPWRLTGFTASDDIETHIQSYAFHLRGVDVPLLRALRSVFLRGTCFDSFWEVVRNQETRFARVAARRVDVGAAVFGQIAKVGDPMLQSGLALFEAGLPFLKRSLTGKFADRFDQEPIRQALAARGYAGDG